VSDVELLIPWEKLEAAVRTGRPDFRNLSAAVRLLIRDRLDDYFERKKRRENFVPKAEIIKESDQIIDAAQRFNEVLNKYRSAGDIYVSATTGSDEQFSVQFISAIIENVAEYESDWSRVINKNHEIDPIPPRKRLGIDMFLLGEQEFGLSSKRTTPPDRGAGVLPTGELFPFVTAVLATVGELVAPTTLEQWSRDAQAEKRRRLQEEEERRDRAGWLHALAQEYGPYEGRPELEGTWEQIADRDWLILSDPDD